jgi:hypothetical protein
MRHVGAIAAPRERSDHRSAVARPVEREEAEAAVEDDDEEFFQIPEAGDFMPSRTSSWVWASSRGMKLVQYVIWA